jgi:hypothetical protein
MPAESLLGLDTTTGDPGGNSPTAQVRAAARMVITLVRVEFGRRRGRPTPRPFTAGAASSSGSNSLLSCVFAADSNAASGTPAASTKMWYFDPGLPRSVGFGPVSSPPFSPAH